MWTVPTLLTLTRIAAIPLIAALFYLPIENYLRNLLATIMFVVFALTDWLDGYLARKLAHTKNLSATGSKNAPKADVWLSLRAK